MIRALVAGGGILLVFIGFAFTFSTDFGWLLMVVGAGLLWADVAFEDRAHDLDRARVDAVRRAYKQADQ